MAFQLLVNGTAADAYFLGNRAHIAVMPEQSILQGLGFDFPCGHLFPVSQIPGLRRAVDAGAPEHVYSNVIDNLSRGDKTGAEGFSYAGALY